MFVFIHCIIYTTIGEFLLLNLQKLVESLLGEANIFEITEIKSLDFEIMLSFFFWSTLSSFFCAQICKKQKEMTSKGGKLITLEAPLKCEFPICTSLLMQRINAKSMILITQ